MAKTRKTTPSAPTRLPNLLVSRQEAEERIMARVGLGKELLERRISNSEVLEEARVDYSKWDSFNAELLRRLFDTPELSEEYAVFYGSVHLMEPSPQERIGYFRDEVKGKLTRLESIKERLVLFIEPMQTRPTPTHSSQVQGASGKAKTVFIVHGHHQEAKTEAANFIKALGLKPIILHKEANQGRTLIEKFEDLSNVSYALILLTADDIGRAVKAQEFNLRARQNVVFELGYFFAALGRHKVCALFEEGIEKPSDIDGLAYIPLDKNGAWKMAVGKELIAAGFEIDFNQVLGV